MSTSEPFSRAVAARIAEKYANVSSEKGFDQSFWRDILGELCQIDVFALVRFQHAVVEPASGSTKFIDGLWPGVLLIEHKSRGKSLDVAETQAREYLTMLPLAERPAFIIVSNFARLRIVDVPRNETVEFPLSDLPDHAHRFESIVSGYDAPVARVEISADRDAALLMGSLFKAFEDAGYEGHETSVFLVRILFLLFADDTRLIRRGLFAEVVASSPEDGTGLGAVLQEVFKTLNEPRQERPSTLSDRLREFPYVNGGLFAEPLPMFNFGREMRAALIAACQYDWSTISPAIFGSLFQAVRDPATRRQMGEHFTSAVNIRRVISSLFLTEFQNRFAELRDDPMGLRAFRNELGTYNWLDPAGGSGNFLIVTYQEVRALEHAIIARLQELEGGKSQLATDGTVDLRIRLSQFHAIEIDEWSSAIARVGMFLADHQSNLQLEVLTGTAPNRFPLTESPTIITGDALELDWSSICPMNDKTFIIGNPPFFGARRQTKEQKSQTERIWADVKGSGSLDYVANWFRIAGEFAVANGVRAAFVASKSITQGEQPPVMWARLMALGLKIDFAHQSFQWRNGAKSEATVHVVIIGLSSGARRHPPVLWRSNPNGDEPMRTIASNINAYLLDAPDVFVTRRSRPLVSHVPRVRYGSQPNDGGFLSNISPEEAERMRREDPIAAAYLRRVIGARELLYDEERYCLWLVGASHSDLSHSEELRRRIGGVREGRLASSREATRDLADTPNLFGFIAQPDSDYIAIPNHSSSDRDYIPFAYYPPGVIATNALSLIPDAPLWILGAISSRPFVIWSHAISGRLGDGIRISGTITYNNFPFPPIEGALENQLASGAKAVLDARAAASGSSLADLYEEAVMPADLRKAHQSLDRAMEDAFGISHGAPEHEVLQAIFDRYLALAGASL